MNALLVITQTTEGFYRWSLSRSGRTHIGLTERACFDECVCIYGRKFTNYAVWCNRFKAIPQLDKITYAEWKRIQEQAKDSWAAQATWTAKVVCCGDEAVFTLLNRYGAVRFKGEARFQGAGFASLRDSALELELDRIYSALPEWARF